MSVAIWRQINNDDGTPLVGATVEAYEVGQTPVVSTTTTDTSGVFSFSLPDTQSTRTNVKYDVKVSFGGSVWWIRAADEAQISALDVTTTFRVPRYTTTQRDALTLGTTDVGTSIYNTTTEQPETWRGSSWASTVTTAGIKAIRKTANESVTSSVTVQDDDHLALSLGANETWVFDMFLLVGNTSGATTIKLVLNLPSGATLTAGTIPGIGALTLSGWVLSQGTESKFNIQSGIRVILITGSVVMGSTAGDLQLQWAQETSSATSTSIYADSYLKAIRV